MVKKYFVFVLLLGLIIGFSGCKTTSLDHIGHRAVLIPKGASEEQIVSLAADVAPSQRQLAWQKLEFTAFFHFTVNTFTDREWGEGTEPESVFNPTSLDARQWVRTAKAAGIKLVILTCKHHDGFCLWPSKFTEHSVKNSPWKNGQGDVVKEVAEACKEEGLKFGVYLSPWDRHEKSYGDTPKYNAYFLNQLRELLTNYGDIAEVWFDGANGEGPNGKRQVYDWKAYYELIRKLQPAAAIAIMGPDVRWVGTESGYGRETEWSVVPASAQNVEEIAATSQQKVGDGAFTPPGDLVQADLGSRSKIATAKGLVWYPSEVDVSIRPGWFYHASEDARVKSPETLLDIYFSSIGRNSVLLLNLPPDRRGLIHEADVQHLQAFRKAVDAIFQTNLAKGARVKTDSQYKRQTAAFMVDDNNETWWAAAANKSTATIEVTLDSVKTFDVLQLQENIAVGQRVENFALEGWINNQWTKVTEGTTIGYKRLLRFQPVTTDRVRLRILSSRSNPTISTFGLYRNLPNVIFNPQTAAFTDKTTVDIQSPDRDTQIHYTLDGAEPTAQSPVFHQPFDVKESTTVKAVAIRKDGTEGFARTAHFMKAKYDLKLTQAPATNYNGGGPLGLVDGVKGSLFCGDGKWSGFNGTDMEAVIDMKEQLSLKNVTVGFLQDAKSWVLLPSKVEVLVSSDGISYYSVGFEEIAPAAGLERPKRKAVSITFCTRPARFVKIVAHNPGPLPAWHPGKGEPSWIMADEIEIES